MDMKWFVFLYDIDYSKLKNLFLIFWRWPVCQWPTRVTLQLGLKTGSF